MRAFPFDNSQVPMTERVKFHAVYPLKSFNGSKSVRAGCMPSRPRVFPSHFDCIAHRRNILLSSFHTAALASLD